MRSTWVSSRVIGVALAGALGAIVVAGCSDDDDGNGDGNGNGANGGGSGLTPGAGTGGGSAANGGASGTGATNGGGTAGGSVAGSPGTGGAVMACPGLSFDAQGGEGGAQACTGVSNEAEVVPVDLFIMMDRSVSMGELVEGGLRRWDAIQEAVQTFVESDNLGDTGIGFGYFNITGAADEAVDCNVDRYAEPAVALGPAADVGPDVVAEMDVVGARLSGLTPLVPALQGALQYAQEYAVDNAGRATVVVLVTDGYPTQCNNMVSAIADVAREARENDPFIRTFVVGIGANFNLNNIALAGGTNAAFTLDESNAVESFTDALLNISNSQLACEYELPPPPDMSQLVDPELVQVVYTPGTGEPEEIPRVSGLAGCGISANGGWYYDNPAAPTRILTCPCTCSRFAAGRVDIRVGCKPRVILR